MKTKTVIAHIITKLELGGAQVNTVYTSEHLDRKKFSVYLIAGHGGLLRPQLPEVGHAIVARRMVRPIRPLTDLRALAELIGVLKRIRPDIVHTHSAKAGILGRLAARYCRVPVIVHSFHGFSFAPDQPFLKRTFYTMAEKLVSSLTTHFIFVAAADIRLARGKKLIRENHSLIRSGFIMKPFLRKYANRAAIRKKHQLRNDQIVCGVIAPFKPQKGLFHLIDIAALVIRKQPRTVFFLAGDGELRPRIEAELKRRGIEKNFRLPGFIQDLAPVSAGFDIGVSCALWEGLPQSLVQLRLQKKPLVSSDIPGHRELIREGRNGFLVNVNDHRRFAARILELIENPRLRKKMGSFSNEDFSEWNADMMVRRQEELYQRLLQSARR